MHHDSRPCISISPGVIKLNWCRRPRKPRKTMPNTGRPGLIPMKRKVMCRSSSSAPPPVRLPLFRGNGMDSGWRVTGPSLVTLPVALLMRGACDGAVVEFGAAVRGVVAAVHLQSLPAVSGTRPPDVPAKLIVLRGSAPAGTC